MSRYSLIFDADSPAAEPFPGLATRSFDRLPAGARRSRYNIGRNQDIIVLRAADEPSEATALSACIMRWGFTPHWIHGPNPALQPLTVPDRKISQPYFRDAFSQRRCLIPATGFYAWQGWENGPAAPYHVYMRNRDVFFMAAIWDNCDGIDRVAMITTEANSLLHPIHDRMPAIIPRDAIDTWLRGERPLQLLAPFPPAAMDLHQVSRKVFAVGNDSAELLEPIATPLPTARAHA